MLQQQRYYLNLISILSVKGNAAAGVNNLSLDSLNKNKLTKDP